MKNKKERMKNSSYVLFFALRNRNYNRISAKLYLKAAEYGKNKIQNYVILFRFVVFRR